ncbi:MAG: S8 family peptidase [Bacteroidetes bacterium]|nr:S8 family peptidase [Bacteroidota bacterium]
MILQKQYFFFLLVFFTIFFSFAQTVLNNDLKFEINTNPQPSKTYHLLVKGDINKLFSKSNQTGIKINYYSGNIASITCNAMQLSNLIKSKIVQYIEMAQHKKLKTMGDTMLIKNRIQNVKAGLAPLPQAYNGSGTIVGLIDTGIDFNHPDFKDSLGNTRILYIWDQNFNTGSAVPAPYNYGIEWTSSQINTGVCTHSDVAHYGHGTVSAGIAAGNGLSNNTHVGVASKANIIMVALNFNSNATVIADAVNYILSKAQALGKPCAINASIGDYYGSHDGTDLEAQLIKNMLLAQNGVAMAAACGNAGTSKFHVKTLCSTTDTLFTFLNTTATNSLAYWCYADTNQIKNVKIGVGANRANYTNIGRIGLKPYNYALNSVMADTLKKNGNRIGIINTSASINSFGVYELAIQIIPDSASLNWRIESSGTGLHHSWNFDFVSTGLPATSAYTPMINYIMPDTMCTMTSGFQCLNEVIAVANHVNTNRWYDVNNALQTTTEVPGAWSGSSIGPTRDGRVKPDISATGANNFSTIVLAMQANLISSAPQVVAQGSFHVQSGGSSAASPVVGGLMALYLQKNPNATNAQIKNAITNCAFTDAFTGAVPNYAYGYGKLDGFATMLCSPVVTSLAQLNNNLSLNAFPNPFSNTIHFTWQNNLFTEIKLMAIDGKIIWQQQITSTATSLPILLCESLSKGIYFASIKNVLEAKTFKLIKE